MLALLSTFGPWLFGIVSLVAGAIGVFLTKKSSDAKVVASEQKRAEAETDVAKAQTQTAEVRDATAQANAVAAQSGAAAIQERKNVESDTARMSDAAVRDELRDWAAPADDTGAAAGGSSGNANR